MAIKKKGVMKVFEMFAYNDNDELLFMDENLTSTSLSNACDESEIKNGKDNANWSVISSNKTLTLTAESNVVDLNKIAVLAGEAIVSGATTMHSEPVVLTPVAGVVTLPQTPIEGARVNVIDLDKDALIVEDDYTISAGKLTFEQGKIPTGDVQIAPFKYLEADGEELVISAENFSSTCRVVLKSVYIDENQRVTHDVEIEIPKAKPSSSWELTAQSDFAQGMTNSMELKAVKDDRGNLGYMRFIKR